MPAQGKKTQRVLYRARALLNRHDGGGATSLCPSALRIRVSADPRALPQDEHSSLIVMLFFHTCAQKVRPTT